MLNLKNKDNLLSLMIFSYLIPIFYIYSKYSFNPSISNIICHPETQNIILIAMICMGFFSILYELERDNHISFLCMSLLLVSIYGVICIDEWNLIHYLFAGSILLSIISFMINHYYVYKINKLLILLVLQTILLIGILMNMEGKYFFVLEVAYILNFALYYIYLHYYEKFEKNT